jgi:integrase
VLPARQRLTRGHHAALPYDDLPAFTVALRDKANRSIAATALEFCILTATRTSETLGATWAEFDLAKGVWTIPAKRMKAGHEHRIPLSSRALAILHEVGTGKVSASQPVFPGYKRGKGLSNMAMLLKRLGQKAITAHGFRSTFRDWAAEQTSFPHEVCEMALAHTIGNKAEAAYRRGDLFDKRRMLMKAWQAFCENRSAGKVVQLRG